MEPRSLKFIAGACGGELRHGQPGMMVGRVCTDSRQVQPGDLFVALAGDTFDGHNFLAEAAQKKAGAVMVERAKAPTPTGNCAVVAVEHTRRALGQMAARYRRDFTLPIIAVGGSNGKTTTKELIAAVLREKFTTLWSEASFNNDIGVPLTLLKLEKTHGAAVLEAGTNHPGELAPLARMIQPQFGVITSIGREHLEFFRDLDGVLREEGWLAELLPANGKLFVNGDVPGLDKIVSRTRAPVVKTGLGAGNDWRASDVRLDADGTVFCVSAPRKDFDGEYRLQLLGRHQVTNALLALAAGEELGLSCEQLQRALAGCTPPKMRLQFFEMNGVRVLDDTYNANADSMRAALRTLRDLPCAGRRVAVLGDMGELGAHSRAAHEEVGHAAAEAGVDLLFAVGKWAGVVADCARARGLRDVVEIPDAVSAGALVKGAVKAGDMVLLKASRAARLEQVVGALKK